MNEELQSKLVEIITAIQTNVGKTASFAVEQLPDIAQQYIAFGRATETLYFAIFLLGVIILPYISFTQVKKSLSAKGDEEIAPMILSMVAGLLGAVSMVGVLGKITPFFMVWFAPKIYLIKGLAALLK